ncbi:MAG: hypothetical protein JEY94_16375 [Melioribacteraceae bacterium]|nr:hypothetical protein [Melioribacteraceae bacterium]
MNKQQILNIIRREAESEGLISAGDKLVKDALRLMFNKQAVPVKMNNITAYVIKNIMKVGTGDKDDKRSISGSK